MSFSASTADERVLDVQSTDDTLSVPGTGPPSPLGFFKGGHFNLGKRRAAFYFRSECRALVRDSRLPPFRKERGKMGHPLAWRG